MKYISILGWILFFLILAFFLQYKSEYHFYLLEQNQLFENSWDYINEHILQPGGTALMISEYLVQYFLLPYAGALITAGLLTFIGIGTQVIVRKITLSDRFWALYLIPSIGLLFVQFSFNYLLAGTVAYLLLLLFLGLILSVRNVLFRIILGWLFTPLVYFLAGPVVVLFALCLTIYEFLNRTPRAYLVLFTWVEIGALTLYAINTALAGEFRLILLPDAYFHPRLVPPPVIYFSWIVLPSVIVLSFFLRKITLRSKKQKIVEGGCQLILLIGLLFWGIPKYLDENSYQAKKLDYYSRNQEWDKIIEECQGQLSNYLYICHLNRALAEKGQLADRMFFYDQRGSRGIMVPWNKTASISILLSDIAFTMGDVASAQQMAFEAGLSTIGAGNPRMIKRLVETNLIYGEYPVAEKYIRLLERTYGYKNWATYQRRFLYNDTAVKADPFLGSKRRSLSKENHLSLIYGLPVDLFRFAEANPGDKSAIEYAGAIFLLYKDLDSFKQMIEKYYGTEVLPVLPLSFQEAIITLSENDPDYWTQFNISPQILDRFSVFKRQVLANKNNPNALPGLLYNSFGNTYWFYFMFKQYN